MNNPSALIIDDDKEVAEPYARVLESLGFATETLQTGEAALSWLAVRMPDLVVLDLHLPSHVSGTEILKHIRVDQRSTETRVIVITGHPDLADSVRDRADLVLLKPVDVSQLRELTARLYPRVESDR